MKLTLMLLVGSAAILVAIFALWSRGRRAHLRPAGARGRWPSRARLQLWVFPLLWLGFGTLAGVFPFHTWRPDGHASAPTAVSMLHAGVLMKLGAFGVMRVGMVLAPEAAVAWAPVVGAVAVVNMLYGALCAAAQDRPQVHRRLLLGEPHGRGDARGGDARPRRAGTEPCSRCSPTAS